MSSIGQNTSNNENLKESAINMNSNGRLYHRYNEIME